MNSFHDLDEYNKASHSIQNHISSINDLLKSARIESTLDNSEFGTKFGEIVNFDFDSCFTDVVKKDYYNEKEVDELWHMLCDSPINSPKKPKLRKAVSSASLLEQTTSSSPKTTTSKELEISEISDHLEMIQKNLENITNMELKILDLKEIQENNLEMNISIQNIAFDIQKIEKDIKNSAATDQVTRKTFVSAVDQDFILLLKQLNQVKMSHLQFKLKSNLFSSSSDSKSYPDNEEQ